MRNGRDGPQQTSRLVDAGSVVGLDAPQIEFNQSRAGDLPRQDRPLNVSDARLLQMKSAGLRGGETNSEWGRDQGKEKTPEDCVASRREAFQPIRNPRRFGRWQRAA
jgi:hypothetical protein